MNDLAGFLEAELARWPAGPGAVEVLGRGGRLAAAGQDRRYGWASVTKLLTALVVLDAEELGLLSLDEPAGPPGATVAHLLAHASGLAVDSDRVLSPPGERRIYSNRGFEVLGEVIQGRTGRPFASQLEERLLDPLGMHETILVGSPAHGCFGPVADLAKLAAELLHPRYLPPERVERASTVAFRGLCGVLPGFGRQEPNDWGLGLEIRGHKSPHWTSERSSSRTFGHFGQAGAFLWVDPQEELACVAASNAAFGPWAASAWPRLSSGVLDRTPAAVGPEGQPTA